VSVTTETLMEALDQILVGIQVERGGALHAKPSEEVRTRIRVFKRLEVEHDYKGDGFGDIEDDLIAENAAEVDRDETLKRIFAAGWPQKRFRFQEAEGFRAVAAAEEDASGACPG
jgi:hypothetical protein